MTRFLWWNAFILAVIFMIASAGALILAIPFTVYYGNPLTLLGLAGLPAAVAFGYAAWNACGHATDEL